MTRPTIISYSTDDYEEYFQPWEKSLPTAVLSEWESVSKDSWLTICRFKPFYIYNRLRVDHEPLLWVDIDQQFVREPRIEEWDELYHALMMPTAPSSPFMAGTVYVQPSAAGFARMEAWMQSVLLFKDMDDNQIINQVCKEIVEPLDPKWAFIPDGKYAEPVKDPIIVCAQASRVKRAKTSKPPASRA